MKIKLPEDVKNIIDTLEEHGFEAYAVGGCVRDSILGKDPADWDITTSAKPEQVKALFKSTIDTGIQHGTVTVLLHHVGYEVTTYRIDGEYEDGRHPKEVLFTPNLLEDLKRRDFTINAMAYNDSHGLVDEFDGIGDLERGIIRCVGDPKQRFTEDALRMMRAVRFAAQLGFEIEDATREAARELAPNLAKVSAERIQVELVKLLLSDHPHLMRDLYELGLTAVFLPEWDLCMVTEQHTIHHAYTVGEHTIRVLGNVPADRVLRLSALLHDIAKPECKTTDAEGNDHFDGHPVRGNEMAGEILRRLKFDNDTMKRVQTFVRYHDERPELDERAIRWALSEIGTDAFPELFTLKRADTLGQSEYMRREKLEAIDRFEAIYQEIMERKDPLTMKDLAVNGQDLMALGVERGPVLGETLKRLLAHVLDNPEENTRERLLEIARGELL
jgi:tRNA nucleotidyltransferase (CCA-adding enzyme)